MKIKIDKADRTFSKAIRTRDNWTCQRCGRKFEKGSQGLHASHYFGRGRENTRFDPENVDSLGMGCHQIWGSEDKEGYRNFKIKQLGQEGFDRLTIRAAIYKKKDREMSFIEAKQFLALIQANLNTNGK